MESGRALPDPRISVPGADSPSTELPQRPRQDQAPPKERFVLVDSLIAGIEAARPVIEQRNHQLTIDLPPEQIYLDADPARLVEAFANLVTSAAKSIERNGRIRVRVERKDGAVVIGVQHDGIGIAPETLSRVFEGVPGEGDTASDLSVTRSLVKLHGGSIEAQSQGLGFGSELIVTLPLAVQPVEALAPGPSRQRPHHPGQPIRVLVADDNKDSADGLALLIDLAGHQVRAVYGGRQALAVGAEFRPEVVILDIGMPDLDGYEVARQIREASWGKHLTLIAITGWGGEADRRRAEAAGFDHHRTKPLDFELLEPLIAAKPLDQPGDPSA